MRANIILNKIFEQHICLIKVSLIARRFGKDQVGNNKAKKELVANFQEI